MREDCGGRTDIVVNGCSFGAYHAANFALKRADLFPLAICQSGVYDVGVVGGGARGDAVYFNNPMDYVSHLHGDHLDWLRGQVSLLIVVRPGPVGGHDGRAREHEAVRRAPRRRRESRTSSTSGATTSRTTGPRGARSSPTTCRGSVLRRLERHGANEHLIGLLLGTEEDWPTAFEALVERVGPVDHGGEQHVLNTERIVNEPFDLRYEPRYSLVIDRLAWWYHLPREWLKKIALMDDVYLLNSPFTFQAMEKHAAYCAMMRLGFHVPETWLLPHKVPPSGGQWEAAAASSRRSRRGTTRRSTSRRSRSRSATRCS